ncbi:TetR/AcrR family transcriptional regulator [Corynebacterium coyleae]|uniref:TetR/AcrR family transcriptional regulator n=1 Tax=Corynebacterium coyleae TaxID=53374 RepID=A0ABX8KZS2_9CORY|nr:helix-turn-helix domain-containing protein [Corynebacterium coyleae]QXB19269.1 TetR/AcrR family transcriptional regulator [Corynebacterium coyleae]
MKHYVRLDVFSDVRQDAADNRYAIVTAARQLLVDEGPHVSMRTIAGAAKVGVATVTRHFPERTDLYDAVSEQTLNDIVQILDDHSVEFTVDTRKAWRDTIHAIGNLGLAAIAQGSAEKRAAEVREIYDGLLAPAKRAKLCPADLDPLELHFSLGIVSRPLPAPAPDVIRWDSMTHKMIDTLLDGWEAQAHSAEY